MPPGYSATVGQLETFVLPNKVSGTVSDITMAKAMMKAWQRDGILQITMTQPQRRRYEQADAASRHFFGKSPAEKRACVDAYSYAGYVASGEEITGGITDYSEIFTVTKDLHENDPRVRRRWPCHGPSPWPDSSMRTVMRNYVGDLGENGETILQLLELGLDVPQGSLTKYTKDGWHHMRNLR